MAPSPRTRRLSRRTRPLSVDFNIYEDQPVPTIARHTEIPNIDIAMYQYTPAPKPPRGTIPPATNLANPSDPPNPQTNTKTYGIVWIYSKFLGIYSSMEDAEAEGTGKRTSSLLLVSRNSETRTRCTQIMHIQAQSAKDCPTKAQPSPPIHLGPPTL